MLESLKIIKEFDPDIPDRIIDLPLVEMQLALYPGQDNFDKNFKRLFECKSFDFFYIYEKIQGRHIETIDIEKLEKIAIMEHIRDFTPESIAMDTDLNLYKYIRDNNLNPKKLIDYLIHIYKRNDPVGFIKAKEEGLFDGIESADSIAHEKIETDRPFHESFYEMYSRAIRLLRELM